MENKIDQELIYAADTNDSALVLECLKNEANVNFRASKSGMTALHIAAALKYYEVCSLLLLTGKCDLYIKDYNGMTASDYFDEPHT